MSVILPTGMPLELDCRMWRMKEEKKKKKRRRRERKMRKKENEKMRRMREKLLLRPTFSSNFLLLAS